MSAGWMRGSPSGGGFCSHGFPAPLVRRAAKQDKNRNTGGRPEASARKHSRWEFPHECHTSQINTPMMMMRYILVSIIG